MSDNNSTMESLTLYSDRCVVLLRQAVEMAESEGTPDPMMPKRSAYQSRYAGSSSDEQAEGSSSSESEDEEEEKGKNSSGAVTEKQPTVEVSPAVQPQGAAAPIKKKKKRTKMDLNQRQRESLIQKHFQNVSCTSLPLLISSEFPTPTVVELPSGLLSKDNRMTSTVQQARAFYNLSTALNEKPVVILFLRSGRFAGAVFQKHVCITHRALQRYTVRRGQGKAQSAQDSQGRPKSMGAQLRRAGEVALNADVTATLMEWKTYIQTAGIILISCPKTMKKNLFEGAEQVWRKDDDRIRRVPLDMGRPSFESVCIIHAVLMTVVVREYAPPSSFEVEVKEVVDVVHTSKETHLHDKKKEIKEGPPVRELSSIHVAAKEGDLESLARIILDEAADDVDEIAGEEWMTALHFAALSTTTGVELSVAAECVHVLLEKGHANPCIVDARNRPPYFLASHDKVRDSFRIARANLGEEYCSWDDAKVGPPLTLEDLDARTKKEAEKRKKKKIRQKEKNAKEKAQTAEAERFLQEEQTRKKQEEEAKRIRDGLQPKNTPAGNVCDFCQTVCKGRRRNQMLKRLEYSYCSSECVQKHKRELMASAALARFGG
jgi:hypothetical protein